MEKADIYYYVKIYCRSCHFWISNDKDQCVSASVYFVLFQYYYEELSIFILTYLLGLSFSFNWLISQVEKQINTILQKADYKTETKETPL